MTLLLLITVAASSLSMDTKVDLSASPISKVVVLLKDMQATLNKDAKADEELYEQLSCWCTTNGGNKKAAVATAGKRISDLTATIEEMAAKSAELKVNIEKHGKEVAKNQASIAEATQLRNKENGEFTASEQELTDSLRQVSGAVDSLSKHHESFMQFSATKTAVVAKAVVTLRQNAAKVLKMAHLKSSQRHALQSFLQQMPSSGSYSSRSGAIYGILNQMKETFEANLAQSRKDEGQAQSEFEAMRSSKQSEVDAGKAAISAKTQELAETDEALVHAKHDLKKTRAALSADQKFLLDLEETCSNADAEYAERQKMRNDEIAGVGDALAILEDDSARDLFSSTLGFVQKEVRSRSRAARVLAAAGAKAQNQAMLSLANTVALDAFTKVKASIDEMVVALKSENQEEVDHQRFCTKELAKNSKATGEANDHVKDLSASLDDMSATIDTLKKEVAALQQEVSDTNVAIKRASEDRAAENAEFQQTVSDQRATQMILAKVLDRLGKVYQTSLVQQPATEPGADAPEAPAGFSEYKQQGSGGVMALIAKIRDEASTLEKEALHAEQTAQTAYERFVQDSAAAVGAANRSISAKSAEKAQLESSSVAAAADRRADLNRLEHLGKQNAQLHNSCDYVLNNFDARQQARGEEIDALNNAKAILSGADFD